MTDRIDLSSYSLGDLYKLNEQVLQEIERQKKTEVITVRTKMEALASNLGMTVEEVLAQTKMKTNNKHFTTPKYRNPADPEQTWTGRGKRPRWLQQALSEGAELEDFAI